MLALLESPDFHLIKMTFCINLPKNGVVNVFIRDSRCGCCGQVKEFSSENDFSFNPFYYMPRLTESVDVFIYTTDKRDEALYSYFYIFLPDDSLYPGGERKINLAIEKRDGNPIIMLTDEEGDEYRFEEAQWYDESCEHLLGNIQCKDFTIEVCRKDKNL